MSPRPQSPGFRLDIGELHLHGFGPEHRERFEAALHAALGDMARTRGRPAFRGLRPPPIDSFRHDASVAEPEAAARETAAALWAQLAPGPGGGGSR